jgi:hypothetical protein
MGAGDRAAQARVANGEVRPGDWVRELPASHFQPCYCCLCRPPLGVRPSLRVAGIELSQERVYLRLEGDGAFPADEYEKVDPPPVGAAHATPNQYPYPYPYAGTNALMRDPRALAERLAREARPRGARG